MKSTLYLIGFVLSTSALAYGQGESYGLTGSGAFGGVRVENQVETCKQALREKPEANLCKDIFLGAVETSVGLQYSQSDIKHGCAQMPTVESTLTCFTEIHEVGFRRSELLLENEPGLANQFAQQWKKNVMRECPKELTKKAALECAILQKSGTRFAYREKNEEIARQAATNDPILHFCRNSFGDYWEGVEICVKEQRRAKKRLLGL